MKELKQIKIYATDKEFLKANFKGTFAEVINVLIWGKDEKFKQVLESYAENYFNPKIEQIKETLREAISQEIERRFKELSTK